jgi:hypothetical protein
VTSAFGTSPFVIAAVLLGLLGLVFIVAGLSALRRIRPLRFTLRTLVGLLLLALGALAGAVGLGMTGYRALTREDLAARILVRPVGRQRFDATFRIPDRPEMTFDLAGDEIYVDARILKWTPVANLLGLHTAYELDRVAGRYIDIEKEQSLERTVYSLAEAKPVDLFALRRRYAVLAPIVDAEYGSGSFVPVTRPAEFEVRVSTTGLLIREVTSGQKGRIGGR